MKTKTRILLSIAASFTISVLILFFVFVILLEIDNEAERVRAYASVQDKTEALNLSIAKLASRSDPSIIRQIESVRDSMENLLGTLKAFDVREESLLRQIRTNANELAYSLEKLVSSSGEPGEMRAERLDVLVSQLAMKIQFISDDTLRLMEFSQTQIHDAQRQAGILIFILILALIVINAAISIFSGRIVMRAQESLLDSLGEAERKGRVLEATMEQLRQSEQRYRALFDSIEEGFCVFELIYDDNGRVVDWVYLETNPAFCRLTGWKDPVGRRIGEFLPDLEDEWFDRYARIADTGESMRFEDQTTVSGKWYDVYAFRVGKVQNNRIAILFNDITERTLAEEALRDSKDRLGKSLAEKEVLLKEIHHRVKNNMQVISSLVSLQAEELEDEAMRDVLKDVTHRVRSMALVHEKLYQSSDLARVDFAEYARSLLDYLWRAHGATAAGIRLVLETEPVPLSATAAAPCGLVLNELAGNALKHAFPDGAGGKVFVSFHRTEGGQARLIVRDNGKGLPEGFDWTQSRSLGLRLVGMLARQLHASVEVSGDRGTEFAIAFKIGNT